MPLRLYIIHASEDQARVNQLRDELKAAGFQVFLCEDLPAGSDWQKEIDQELKQAVALHFNRIFRTFGECTKLPPSTRQVQSDSSAPTRSS